VTGAAFQGDLEKVRAAEDLLFGSTECGSLLRIRTSATPAAVPGKTHCSFGPSLNAAEIASLWGERDEATLRRLRLDRDGSRPVHYLGFGPIVGNQLERPYLLPETAIHFEILWMRDREDPKLRSYFDQALWAWLHLGGIGGRSRRGFGSLQRTPVPPDRTDFMEKARALLKLGNEAGRLSAEWTCFNASSRIFVAREACGSWSEAMTRLGAWLIAFRRRYGFPADSRPGLANRDYEWAALKGSERQKPSRQIPDRAGFGLPIHFGSQETVTWDSGAGEDARRASPLLLHVARIGSSYLPVLTHLPSAFLPAGKSLKFKRSPPKAQLPTSHHLGIVDHFLDDLVGKKKIEEVV
jgi:CRISPR-associated protein Cmr1